MWVSVIKIAPLALNTPLSQRFFLLLAGRLSHFFPGLSKSIKNMYS